MVAESVAKDGRSLCKPGLVSGRHYGCCASILSHVWTEVDGTEERICQSERDNNP